LSDSLGSRIESILNAIPGGHPAGRSARYDPEYETLKAETDKIGSVAAASVDWGKVGTIAGELLQNKSKDLLVMSYFSLAQFETGGYAGLAASLGGMRKLIERYWDGLFPEASRLRARVAAIEWLIERCAAAVQRKAPAPDEAAALATCVEETEALDSCLREKLLNDAPSLGDIRGALNERISATAGAELEPATSPDVSRAAVGAPAPMAAFPVAARDLSSSDARDDALKETLATLKSLAVAIRHADPRDPLGYRLVRVAAWGRVRGTPSETDGRTSVPALGASPETLERLATIAGRGEWSVLVEQAESQFLESVLWLDVHRFSAQALKGMGREFERAERVVVHELGLHIRSFPKMLELTFSNGMPFASEETREWIGQVVLSGSGPSEPAMRSAAAGDGGKGQDEAIVRAVELARSGKVGEAVGVLADGLDRPASARDRFQRRMALARILAEARELRAALAQMERVEADLARFGIEEWEPGLAVEAISVHLRLQRALAKSEGKGAVEVARKAEELYARLAGLDARAALALKS
jgi:type VI secretion system protein VasJ